MAGLGPPLRAALRSPILAIANSSVSDVDVAAEAKKYEMRYGPVRIDLDKVTITNAKQRYKRGPESVINVDGQSVNDTGN